MRFLSVITGLLLIAQSMLAFGEGVKWQPLYEPGCGGWITSVAADPRNPRHLLIGGDMLGIGVSDSSGDQWAPAFGLPTYEICDFTFHPTEPNVVWAGSFAGPVKSTDGGKNWVVKRNGFVPVEKARFSEIIEKVLIDPANTRRLVAVGGNSRRWNNDGSKSGLGAIYESLDAGESWQLLARIGHGGKPGQQGENLMSAWFAPNSSNTMYSNTLGGGVIVSLDGGRTWEERNSGLRTKNVYRVVIHPKDPNILWACTDHYKEENGERRPGGIYKTTDGGKTWFDSSKGLPKHVDPKNGNFCASFKGLAVSPVDPNLLVTSDQSWNKGGIYLSRDGGASWSLAASRANVGHDNDQDELQKAGIVETAYPGGVAMTTMYCDPVNANVIYALGGEYALRSTDGGKNWLDITAHRPDPKQRNNWRGNGYSGLCSSDFVFHPTDPNRSMLIALDAGKVWESLDGMKTWRRHGNDPWPWGGAQAGTYSGEYGYVTAGQFGGWLGIVATRDGGKSWRTLLGTKHGLPEQNKGGEPRGILAHPTDGKRVWASIGNKLFASTDAGEQWSLVKTPEAAIWLAGDPTKPGRFYFTGNNGSYVTDDGVSFRPIGGPKGSTLGQVTCDALGRFYVVQWRASRSGVWRYDGKTWERLSDDFTAHAVDIDPKNPKRLVMVTNDDPFHDATSATGVWISVDDGKSWSQANDGLGMLRIRCVRFNPHNPTQLVVGTWGGGYYLGNWPSSYAPQGARSYSTSEEDQLHAALNLTESKQQVVGSIRLNNPSFSAGTDVPMFWAKGWVGRGEVKVARDTGVFRSAPASLRVEAIGDAVGQGNQTVDAKAGETFNWSGFVRSQGNVKVNVAVQSFDSNWRPVDFVQACYLAGEKDWTTFNKNITVAKNAAHVAFVLLVEGEGRAWLDDLSIKPADAQQ